MLSREYHVNDVANDDRECSKEMTRPAVLQFAFSPRHVTRLERDLQCKLDIERFASS
jgi:hypothetical protein